MNAGTFYWNLNNASGNSNANITTHLLCINYINTNHLPWLLPKHKNASVCRVSRAIESLASEHKTAWREMNMKRYGNIFHKIIGMDNLLLVHQKARKGKTHYKGWLQWCNSYNLEKKYIIPLLEKHNKKV